MKTQDPVAKTKEMYAAIQTITEERFKKYGYVIEKKEEGEVVGKNLFRIIAKMPSAGWRAAYLLVRDRSIAKLENHPDTKETFEPVRGASILCVAPPNRPEAVEAFILDKAVLLHEGVWHGIVTLSEESEVKICENADLGIAFHPLKRAIAPVLVFE